MRSKNNVGRLNKKINFTKTKTVKSSDPFGGMTTTQELVFENVRASIEDIKEYDSSGYVVTNSTKMNFVVRNRMADKIDTSMNVQYKGRTFKIVSIEPDFDDDKWLKVVVER